MAANLVETVKAAVRESGVTLIELAQRSGVDVGQLSRLLNDKRTVTLETADKILSALGCRISIGPPKSKPRAPARKPKRKDK